MEDRLMIIGLVGAGKSTISDLVEGEASDHRHREDCFYRTSCFEVPGSYIENQWMHSILIMLSQNQASAVLLLIDGATGQTLYNSGFARAFNEPCLGVLTKCDLLEESQRERGCALLAEAGCDEVLCVSAETGEGLDALMTWVRANVPVVGKRQDQKGGDAHVLCNGE